MKLKRTAALLVAALVLGFAAGNVVTGFAAPDPGTATTATGVAGVGMRLGVAMRDAGGRLADVVASLTGLDAGDVREQREAGTSYAAIAGAKDIESSVVIDEAMKIRTEVLSKKVADGTITQAQADAAADRMKTRLSERIDSTDALSECAGQGAGGMGGGMGCGARDGSGAGAGRGMGRNGGGCMQTTAPTQ